MESFSLNRISTVVISMTFLSLGNACRSTPRETPVMPPNPPSERIQSSINPPRPTPSPALPEGVILFRDGTAVTLELLEPPPAEPGSQTIVVQAAPSTPYREVERVLDRLHSLGYLITFTTLDPTL